MAYSNTYNFVTNTLVSDFIIAAFERIGIYGDAIVGIHNKSAITSLNFILAEWADKGFNLFTVQKQMFQLIQGQPSYLLPQYTVETPEVTASNNLRLLGGTPFSSAGGNAANAFSGTGGTACTQVAPNGYISYVYANGSQPVVFYVGVQSNVSTNYTLVVEYSYDNVTWINNLTTPLTSYPIGQIIWWVVNTPVGVQAIRIRETGGSTLNVQQIYFSQPTQSRNLTPISREEYTYYVYKLNIAEPSSFYLDRQGTPSMTLWPTPDSTYSTVVYNAKLQIQDITSINQNISVPQRFYRAALYALASDMALIYRAQFHDKLKPLADEAYSIAIAEDTESVPLRIYPNINAT